MEMTKPDQYSRSRPLKPLPPPILHRPIYRIPSIHPSLSYSSPSHPKSSFVNSCSTLTNKFQINLTHSAKKNTSCSPTNEKSNLMKSTVVVSCLLCNFILVGQHCGKPSFRETGSWKWKQRSFYLLLIIFFGIFLSTSNPACICHCNFEGFRASFVSLSPQNAKWTRTVDILLSSHHLTFFPLSGKFDN